MTFTCKTCGAVYKGEYAYGRYHSCPGSDSELAQLRSDLAECRERLAAADADRDKLLAAIKKACLAEHTSPPGSEAGRIYHLGLIHDEIVERIGTREEPKS